MRKFGAIALNEETFLPSLTVKNEDGTIDHLPITIKESKYSEVDQKNLDKFDSVLAENNKPLMTDEEKDYWVKHLGSKSYFNVDKEPTPDELQKLSGFILEKKITKFPADRPEFKEPGEIK